jgi:hypothetical protein
MVDDTEQQQLFTLPKVERRSGEDSPAHVSKSLARIIPLDANKKRLLDSAGLIADGDPGEILFQHTVFCQTGLPYRDPGFEVLTWDRKQGAVSLRMRSGEVEDFDAGRWRPTGLPFGPKPRLILAYLNAEALRTRSPQIEVEESLTAFVKRIGLPSKGKNMAVVKDQLTRLSSAEVKLSIRYDEGRARQAQGHIVSGFELWFPHDDRQRVLWPTTVTLSAEYFESLQRHAVPLAEHAVAALRNNTLGLDVYCWLAQRLHRIKPGLPQFIPWSQVKAQFGDNYGRMDNFKRVFRQTLAKVLAVYPDARIETDGRGLTLRHSRPPILKTTFRLPPTDRD